VLSDLLATQCCTITLLSRDDLIPFEQQSLNQPRRSKYIRTEGVCFETASFLNSKANTHANSMGIRAALPKSMCRAQACNLLQQALSTAALPHAGKHHAL